MAEAARTAGCSVQLWTRLVQLDLAPAREWNAATIEQWLSEEIPVAEAAAIGGIKPSTFRSYVRRGQAPAPHRHYGRTPVWTRAVIIDWMNNRPGIGARSDLHKPSAGL